MRRKGLERLLDKHCKLKENAIEKTDAKEDGTFEKSYILDTQAFAVGKSGTYRWLILPKS